VDDFILGINRAVELTAPKAKSIFEDSVNNVSFENGQKVLGGGNTSAME
jgi:hypothetical protein